MALAHDIRPAPPGAGPLRRALALPVLAGAWSALAVLLGLWWWATGSYPFGPSDPQDDGSVLAVVPAAVAPSLLVGAGALGILVAVVAAAGARRAAAGRDAGGAATALVVTTAVLHGVAFLLLAPGTSLLVLAGYLMAALGPVVLLGTLLAGALRSRLAGGAAAVLVLALVAAWLTGIADGPVVGEWASQFAQALLRTGPRMLVLLFLAGGGALWLAVGWAAVRTVAGGALPQWARPERAARWGRVATVVAALCALPYVLVRVTWLTPWPLGVPEGADLQAMEAVRLQGLLLGGAAVAGAVLTTGLVARWGEVWPRWVPGLRGRPVPVAAAVVPATLVGVLLCAAAGPMTVTAFQKGQPVVLLMFPLPVWGPALGLAALGYALRRRSAAARPGTIEGP
jgi:hypothetical protein